MDRALAAETAAKASEEARLALADAKEKTDAAEVAARNLADVSEGMGPTGGGGGAGLGGKKKDNSIGEKIGIALFFILLVAALLFWWFQYGRGQASTEGYNTGMASTADYGSMNYGGQDRTV